MSYRTRVNEVQIFGNNDCYQEWIDFLKSEGIKIDEDYCYDGYITNLQGMFNVIDTITRGLINDRHNQVVMGELTWEGKPYKELTDLSESIWLGNETPLLMYNMQMIESAYCFLPYQVFKAVENIIEKSDIPYVSKDGKKWYCCSYKLKADKKIHVYAS